MRADRRLYVNRAWTRLVDEASDDAAFLLAGKGQEIAAEAVQRLGLVEHAGQVMQTAQAPEPVYEMEMEPAAEMAPEPEPEAAEPIMSPQSRRSRRKY
jgi:hypothetical protein